MEQGTGGWQSSGRDGPAAPAPVARLIEEFHKLPGVGPKSAQRLTYYLLRMPAAEARALAEAILDVKERITFCTVCQNVTDGNPCRICASDRRDRSIICVTEVILATNPNLEGEATAMYLTRLLRPLGLKVTRLARGLPVGGDLEYADDVTLTRAMEGRQEVEG